MVKRGWILVSFWAFTACVSSIEPTETPFILQRIAVASEFEGLISPWVSAYVESSGHPDLKLELFPPGEVLNSLDAGTVALAIGSMEVPVDWFATPLWREAIAVIVNPKVKLESLDIDNLAEVFSGRVEAWDILTESSGLVQPIVPLPGSIIRERFLQVVMGDSSFDSAALIGGTPDMILELVKSNPGAIGILPMWRVEGGVDVIAIGGIFPEETALQSGAYPLWLDIVAVSPQEPIGHIRDFIVWLQGTYLPSDTIQ